LVGLFRKSPEKLAKKKANLLKKEIKKLVKQKRYNDVLKVGTEILEKIPNDLDILFVVGGIYHMRGKFKLAISHFDRILNISSYDPEALLMKAKSLFELKRFDECTSCCKKIQEIDPKNKGAQEFLDKMSK